MKIGAKAKNIVVVAITTATSSNELNRQEGIEKGKKTKVTAAATANSSADADANSSEQKREKKNTIK